MNPLKAMTIKTPRKKIRSTGVGLENGLIEFFKEEEEDRRETNCPSY